ncbi:MAG: phosphatidylinositol-specific phospholipase C [Rubripirellula sp.]|jgi:1-phosphatidylinositol phosphodiesterase|nr:phosphatidylinositol-specific phospholipase C [Planctomycetaceae bacterium]MDF1843290.1 phosphatidylinositol-specific phospholipase C [Rubripirellula sp.]
MIFRSLLVLLVFLSFAVEFIAANGQFVGTSYSSSPQESAVDQCSNWMSRLPDGVLLSQLSLPGTHNTCALYNGFSFGFAKCQSWSLADQLNAGVRFIDIRCRHIGDQFLIHHGIINQRMTFESVRDVCQEFLNQHPSECIVMSVKEEAAARDNTRSFANAFKELTKEDGKLWHSSHQVPALETVRGRIVLVDRVGDLGGLRWDALQRQDNYTAPVNVKKKLIRSHLERASAVGDHEWFINFCSGTLPGQLITPQRYASQTNRTVIEFLQQPSLVKPVRLGTIVMDFPSEDLIEEIVEANFAKK